MNSVTPIVTNPERRGILKFSFFIAFLNKKSIVKKINKSIRKVTPVMKSLPEKISEFDLLPIRKRK
jgi:hypothetical protein